MPDEKEPPIIWHDTLTILDVNEAACRLFDCEPDVLIDKLLLNGIARDDMRGLTAARLQVIRTIGDMPPQDLPFLRPNGTRFWANVQTHRLDNGRYETRLTYKYDY
jgi:PAS domain S-box-containing protein